MSLREISSRCRVSLYSVSKDSCWRDSIVHIRCATRNIIITASVVMQTSSVDPRRTISIIAINCPQRRIEARPTAQPRPQSTRAGLRAASSYLQPQRLAVLTCVSMYQKLVPSVHETFFPEAKLDKMSHEASSIFISLDSVQTPAGEVGNNSF